MSTFSTHPPLGHRDLPAIVSELLRRVENLEALLNRAPTGAGDNPNEITYTLSGPVQVDTSPRYYPTGPVALTDYLVSLGTAASTSTTILVKVNGTTEATITVPASTQKLTGSLDIVVTTSDYVTVGVSVVGTGADDLFVSLRYG